MRLPIKRLSEITSQYGKEAATRFEEIFLNYRNKPFGRAIQLANNEFKKLNYANKPKGMLIKSLTAKEVQSGTHPHISEWRQYK